MRRILTILPAILLSTAMLAGNAAAWSAPVVPVAAISSGPQLATAPPPAPNLGGETDPNASGDCPSGSVKTSSAFGGKGKCLGSTSENPIFVLLQLIIRFLSGMFGLTLVLILVISGFQYIISNGSPDDTKSAKNRLKAAVTAFVLYIVAIGALQLILPTGTKLFGS